MTSGRVSEAKAPAPTRRGPSCDEVLGLRVVADDGVRRLLGLHLEPLAHRDADAVPSQKLNNLGVIIEIGAGGIPPRIAAAPVLLAEQPGQRGPVLVGVAELLADAPVPVLGRRFGHLDAQAV